MATNCQSMPSLPRCCGSAWSAVIAAAACVGLPADNIAYLRSLAPGAALAPAPVARGRAIKYTGKPLWSEDAP